MNTPNPLLVAKMTRLALGFLATAVHIRPTIYQAIWLELLDEMPSTEDPKVREKIAKEHMAVLNWLFEEALTKPEAVEATPE
jgi:hypothetical protein